MEFPDSLACADAERRALIKGHLTLNGIDYIEVPDPSQPIIEVFFIPKDNPPANVNRETLLHDLDNRPEKFVIEGGMRIGHIKVLYAHLENDHLKITVSTLGDFSSYTLAITHELLDPAYSRCAFSFKAGCPVRFDCKPALDGLLETRAEPSIDYLAKDYASFRQALLDLIPRLVPDWQERHEADLDWTTIRIFLKTAYCVCM